MNNTLSGKLDKEGEPPNKLDDFEMKKSSGPSNEVREVSGSKRTGNKNALSHGVYSKDVVLPFESQSDFEALVDDLRKEWHPNGRSEEEAVFDLAYVAWLKWRVRKWAQFRFHGQSESKSIDDKLSEQTRLAQVVHKEQEQVQNPYKYAEFRDQTDLLTKLDAQNDKILRRLTSLKVFKRVEAEVNKPPPQIESPPTAPTDTTETKLPPKGIITKT